MGVLQLPAFLFLKYKRWFFLWLQHRWLLALSQEYVLKMQETRDQFHDIVNGEILSNALLMRWISSLKVQVKLKDSNMRYEFWLLNCFGGYKTLNHPRISTCKVIQFKRLLLSTGSHSSRYHQGFKIKMGQQILLKPWQINGTSYKGELQGPL